MLLALSRIKEVPPTYAPYVGGYYVPNEKGEGVLSIQVKLWQVEWSKGYVVTWREKSDR